MKVVSYIFYAICNLFILLVGVELYKNNQQAEKLENQAKSTDDLFSVKVDYNLLTGISIMIFAFSM